MGRGGGPFNAALFSRRLFNIYLYILIMSSQTTIEACVTISTDIYNETFQAMINIDRNVFYFHDWPHDRYNLIHNLSKVLVLAGIAHVFSPGLDSSPTGAQEGRRYLHCALFFNVSLTNRSFWCRHFSDSIFFFLLSFLFFLLSAHAR